jgi:hypothetical protein
VSHSTAILAFILAFGALVCMTTLFVYYRVKAGASAAALKRVISSLDQAIARRKARRWEWHDLNTIWQELIKIRREL